MADIELVISISKENYKSIKEQVDKRDYPDMETGRAIRNGTPLPHCKDCKHFEYDSVAKVNGIPLIVAHEICSKWGDGCKSSEKGFCFLFERKEEKGS